MGKINLDMCISNKQGKECFATRLFIIGNGFDIDHELPTKYSCFREYLVNKYKVDIDSYPLPPQSRLNKDGEDFFDETEQANFLYYIINEHSGNQDEWYDFENVLGKMHFGEFIDDGIIVTNRDGTENPMHTQTNIEILKSDIVLTFEFLQTCFSEWIEEVNEVCAQPKYKDLIFNEPTLFITFNYTTTLEKVYGVDSKCIVHIHGTSGRSIQFGHYNSYDIDIEDISLLDESLINQEVFEMFRKPVNDNIYKKIFPLNLRRISSIYIFGASLKNGDEKYLEAIFSRMDTSTIELFISDFKVKDGSFDSFSSELKALGFFGTIKSFPQK